MTRNHHAALTLTRRRLLQVGILGTIGLGLPQLLRAGASPERRPGSRAKSCIFVVLWGGASHIDTWDPKPGAPAEIRGPYAPIASTVPGIQLSELQPRLTRVADRLCLIRSLSHTRVLHEDGLDVCLTGHSQPKPETPSIGSVLAKLRPADRLPSYVWLQAIGSELAAHYLTGGFLGQLCGPMEIGKGFDNPAATGFRVRAFDTTPDVTTDRLHERHALLKRLDPSPDTAATQNLREYQERAVALVAGKETRQAFNLDREPAALRDRYGRHPIGQNFLLARRLIEAGVRLVTVNAWAGVPAGEAHKNGGQTWDMHGQRGCSIFGNSQVGLGFGGPRLDQGLSALVEDLHQRGLLDSTLLVAVGEFGRAPRITIDGEDRSAPGRDHWPKCYSALLAGASVRGGQVYGASDKIGAFVKDRPVSPEDFAATLFHALGVPPETRLSPDGFTHPASLGKPILDLFG
jgi:uncharacterized protein (DUF1501 family)